MIKREKAKLKVNTPWNFQGVCNKIDDIASKLANEIIKYEPLDLLHRAFWTNVSKNIETVSSSYSVHDRYLSGQVLEFIQNYLASLEPAKEKQHPVNDGEWRKIEGLVRDFNNSMIPFFILRSKYLEENSKEYDFKSDAIRTLDMMHWWGVRGNRYHVHQITQVRELLLPHKRMFEETFEYGIEAFLGDLEKIQYSLTFGFDDAFRETMTLYEKTVEFAKELTGSDDYPNGKQMETAIGESGIKEKSKDALERAFGLALCDVSKITDMPSSLLDELSWEMGQDKDYWAAGTYAGWPLRVTPLRKRPFIKLQNRYYCFDMHNLFDTIYRKIECLVLNKKPESREIWNSIRKGTSEKVSLGYLASLLPYAKVYSPAYYGRKGFRAETDGVIVYDDVLLIVEVKSGALDTGSPLLDFDKHQKKLIELIENPATQAKKFREYLIANKEIEIFDGNRRNSLTLSKLRADSFRKIFQCTVSVDNLTHLTARARKLAPLGIQVHTPANWSISLDDLRVYADLLGSPLQFLHFLEQRELAEQSELVELNDELDHLGLYLLEFRLRSNTSAKPSG